MPIVRASAAQRRGGTCTSFRLWWGLTNSVSYLLLCTRPPLPSADADALRLPAFAARPPPLPSTAGACVDLREAVELEAKEANAAATAAASSDKGKKADKK